PEESYRAFRELGAKWMLPMHWGTFDLTDEPVDRPPDDLRREVAKLGGNMDQIRLMAVGERWHLG
ncbi:MAG: MBL fold metallo-hydrolase, partial [Nitrospinaceae bacterium]|nr:MBL fold metallo-hydrolase [Nitrospinaceae bacterium]